MLRRVATSTLFSSRLSSCMRRTFASYPPHEVVGLPALSPTMEQGNLSKWLMQEGSHISPGDIICQIETDKAVVDYEAQDEMYLAKILVPEGTEGITIGQPIMVTCDEEEHVSQLADFKLEEGPVVPQQVPKAPEEIPPKKEEVAIDPNSGAPVVPSDFLVTSQTLKKNVKGPEIPQAPAQNSAVAETATKQSSSLLNSQKWGAGIQKSPISSTLAQRQNAYLNRYGITGTVPLSTSKE